MKLTILSLLLILIASCNKYKGPSEPTNITVTDIKAINRKTIPLYFFEVLSSSGPVTEEDFSVNITSTDNIQIEHPNSGMYLITLDRGESVTIEVINPTGAEGVWWLDNNNNDFYWQTEADELFTCCVPYTYIFH